LVAHPEIMDQRIVSFAIT